MRVSFGEACFLYATGVPVMKTLLHKTAPSPPYARGRWAQRYYRFKADLEVAREDHDVFMRTRYSAALGRKRVVLDKLSRLATRRLNARGVHLRWLARKKKSFLQAGGSAVFRGHRFFRREVFWIQD